MPQITVEWVDDREDIIETEASCRSIVAAYGAYDALVARSPVHRYRMRDGIRIMKRSYQVPPEPASEPEPPQPKIPGRYRRRFR